ncbi:MAG TPA: D-glycero-beta-D-manno-heptose-1,7-bisphosphate 7-phosphatase [Chloroflexus aurantiacus]|jgi:D-glycero-D-manno-heptose 1,7-bisphosphate phosphatase|uniref:D,D-heptose 1,7-bisphosphate phosphatase n=1 Tax=Chloroflexus aurantiacus (strain ATCC 29366 / DSM 635 / J-10-fl) TaxID=324602 RepID=A9WBX7_CHLAA|nr:D-glycero-beta-D-manno-heptose 1,7-bisphosphate 7-phosphatase [Chloroflexus aurantiacus]ABY36929.1 histidinol-phosphate phosphatase family protein [Chloroflexus aurantiacus J-10-fl]RMG47861.1 MAG: D-glycero-beta-D-manno-heptose 1,7-bisphosphate 7-phosphatase [Chloroflexota bacterium]HBW66640.1 D-glycero-beta-D-manno-heptose-1,7-bisphosphate 7-phosphatase [Chloroflexus aurantiacus]
MRAVFLDRDGVINHNRPDHVKNLAEFQFLPGALTALRLLTSAGFRIFVITNQAAVGRGLMTVEALEEIHAHLRAIARYHGATIDDIRYCPHTPEERCGCRKPQPGMIQELAARHQIDCRATFLIGDALTDIAAGQRMGCQTILVKSGRGSAELQKPELRRYQPTHIADDLLAATRWLLQEELRPVSVTTQPLTGVLTTVPQ